MLMAGDLDSAGDTLSHEGFSNLPNVSAVFSTVRGKYFCCSQGRSGSGQGGVTLVGFVYTLYQD
jgi:hypothetical protein